MTRKKKQKPEETVAPWILEAAAVLRPPDKLTVSEWADRSRVLDSKTSAEPGQWSTDRTPYLRGIMDAINDYRIEELVFVKPTQVGGTEALNNILGYIIAQDPDPVLIVYPTLDLAEYTSKNRVIPMIQLSPATADKYRADESKLLELQTDGMYVVLAGANSPASLASRPIRYLIMDEVDKFPKNAGKEAEPRALARERTRTYNFNRKIVQISTPTVRSGPIWSAHKGCTVKLEYYVPCPHCGHYQTFTFKRRESGGGIVYDKTKTPDEIRLTAYYECEKCLGIIRDMHKSAMLRAGEWRDENGKFTLASKTSFRINAIYSPWLRFGDIAYEFVTSLHDPDLLMNFINSWLAEPWEQTTVKMNSSELAKRTSGYDDGIVPPDALLITGGVDVQKDRFYYTIRAWGEGMTSWNVRHGFCETWDEIEEVMNLPYYTPEGVEFFVGLCGIDSGYNADDTYSFCALNGEWAVAVKGASGTVKTKYSLTTLDRIERGLFGISLFILDTGYYKDLISNRINRPADQPGAWLVFDGCDEDYTAQVTAEHKVKEKVGNKTFEVWKKKTTSADNHYLDCEVYAAFAADYLGIRYLKHSGQAVQPAAQPDLAVQPVRPGPAVHRSNWVRGG
ncbi:phage terminase large subunit family protein [Paenibacillus dendritiformis]|uniref:phage terminase large subunit family protein n=1 Tax=Paenibacillus dendritiformis TaxID=130049 RepID=UPI0010596BA6|nr:terminase gpA endonuclease subunit [Paenibacillus dendritiformis]TDL57852.1 phage terminase large subunit family protein [Paenibacillus dendritiformis]